VEVTIISDCISFSDSHCTLGAGARCVGHC